MGGKGLNFQAIEPMPWLFLKKLAGHDLNVSPDLIRTQSEKQKSKIYN